MQQLRSAWDDQTSLVEKGEARILGDAARHILPQLEQSGMPNRSPTASFVMELRWKKTCSFDPDEAVWWCGVLDPSIPEHNVTVWSDPGRFKNHHRLLKAFSLSRVKHLLWHLKMCHPRNV